ncbi:MAG: SwmB domain-containing protein [Chloroflexi bacterium]|nr:SwmB domain-containing protein [Chloroflexota bacterium]
MLGARFLPPAVFRGGALALVVVAVVMTSLLWAGGSPASAQSPQKPAKPTGLSVTTEQGSLNVSLDWDDTSGATSYKVRWRVADKGNPLNAGITPTSSDADITVAKSGDWVVRVEACNAAGCGDPVSKGFTTIAAQTTVPSPAPTGLTVSAGTSWGELDASWTAPSGVTVTDYDLRYYAGSADPTDEADWVEEGESLGLRNPGTSTSATIARLRTDTVYRVQVRAVSDAGEGAWSDSASARIDSTAPVLRNARVSRDGTKLTLYYDDPLDSGSAPAHGQFSVAVAGSERTLWSGGAVTVSGTTVTMNLGNPAVTVGQTVAVSYTVPGTKPIKNLKGIKAPAISSLAAINDRKPDGAAAQSDPERLAIVSTPSNGTDTYGAGGEIKVEFTFDENVTVDTVGGRPRLKIKLHATANNSERWASYRGGSGTAVLTFSYTVRSSDSSKGGTPETDAGIAVLANSLNENGAWILSAATGRFMNLAHAGLDHDANHKVDGTLDGRAPRFKSAAVDQTTMIITFDENLDTSSAPAAGRFCVDTTDPDGSARSFCGASVSIHPVSKTLVTVTLSEGVRSAEAATVSYTLDATNPLKDAAGNKVAAFSGKRVTNYSIAPGLPTGVWASTPTLGGSLDVNWTAPSEGATPTGYELRYYQGTGDPPAGREADWKEDVAGLPDPGAAATSATIQGLQANTAYRVQVRAKTAAEGGPWSDSASATTGSPSATNNPPRVLRNNGAATGNVCTVVNRNGPIKKENSINASDALVSYPNLVPHGPRTADGEWPIECVGGSVVGRVAPDFDDVDGDKLILSVEPAPMPDNVRVDPDFNFLLWQNNETNPNDNGRLFFQGQSAFRAVPARAVRAKVTATDPHGASVSNRVYFIIAKVNNDDGAPSLPEVDDLDASTVQAFSHVLPAATGGDDFAKALIFGADPQYYYAISGLPEGLAFDPETRRIFGTPSETGEFTVTYIADDPDTVGSAYLNPETPNTNALNDTASRTFTINVRPYIGLVRVTSAPTHDANGDGRNDTYGEGDKIAIDVEFFEPVEFDPGTGTTETNTVQLAPVRVGRDSDTSAGDLKTADLTDVLNGGKTLRFQYTVQSGDNDPDGVSIGSFSGADADKMLVLKGTATLTGLVSKEATSLKRADYLVRNAVDEKGLPLSYVNGYLTTAGPKPTAAHVDGETLTVTFDEDLAALSAADLQSLTFLFGVQGANGTGGNRNAYQHPSSVAMRTDNRTLELTLGVAARAGEQITLSYKLNNYQGPIEDTDGNMAPAFVHLMVTNNTGGGGAEGAAGAAGAAGAGAAAESEVTLVSNTGQSQSSTGNFTNDRAQAFTTGSNTGGYRLTSVAVPYSGTAPTTGDDYAIRIQDSTSSNLPGASLGTLAYGSVSGQTVTYTASGNGIDLDAGTTYWVVLDATQHAPSASITFTDSNNEDSGAADGWSLSDTHLGRGRNSNSWTTTNQSSWQIAIQGTALTAISEVLLVSNTGHSYNSQGFFTYDIAQAFTTGSNAKLTSVKVPYPTAPPASSHTISIHPSNSSNRPGASLGTLSYGSVSVQTVTYTASGNGIPLDAGTTYFVVLDTSTHPNYKINYTSSDSEDSGSAEGWSLGNGVLYKLTADTSWSDDTSDSSWQIAILGVAVPPAAGPQPQLVRVAGTKLKIAFDVALDDTSSVSGEHFEVNYSDRDGNQRTIKGTEADVAISEKTVTVTLDEAVPPNVTAQVTYKPPTPLSLKAAVGTGRVAGFMGFKIEKVYDTFVPELMQVAVAQTGKNPDGFRVALYYDEALDTDTASVPATTDFGVTLDWTKDNNTGSTEATPNAVAVEGNTVVLTVDLAKAPAEEAVDRIYTMADVSYTKGTNPIRDPAGNEAADVDEDDVAVEAAGTPAVAAATVAVKGDEVKLVGNSTQSNSDTSSFAIDRAQAFTTGSNAEGYKLTKLRIRYVIALPTAASHTISINASNSSNQPGGSLGTLSYGSASGFDVIYTAPGDGIALDAGTTYFAVLEFSSQGGTGFYRTTNSNAEDAGAAGWTLADGSFWKHMSATAWDADVKSWKIALHGAALKPVPATVLVPIVPATLVGNTEQTAGSSGVPFDYDYSQAFTTGSNTDGYRLTSVTVPYNTAAPASSSHTISIHASNASDRPDASLGTLGYGTVSGQTVTYTASGNGIALDAETTYFVLLDVSGSPTSEINTTSSGAEDAGASDGWSLADGLLWRDATSSGTWSTFNDTWQIAIQGTAGTAGTVTLVGNTGQSEDSNRDFSLHVAQKFTTGSKAGGYRLTKVSIPYTGSAPVSSSHNIVIHASDGGSLSARRLGTLSYGTVSGTTVTYTASGEGIALAAGTDYFVAIQMLSAPTGPKLRLTNSDSEDAGAADGWSIDSSHRTWAGPGHIWIKSAGVVWQIAIHGGGLVANTQIEKTAYAQVDGASLTVTYDKSLDPTSLPDPDRFTLLDEDGLPVSRVVAVAVAGKQLVLTLNGAVSPCEPAFTLSYSWSETEKNIRTFTGHEAPDIEAEPVINAQADRCVNGRAVVVNGEGASGNSGGGSGQGMQGKSLTLSFDRPLDTGKALKASAFGLTGGAPPAVKGAAYTESGAGVVLTLARGLETGETVTLGYARPAGDPGLWDAEGNQIAEFSGVAVPVRTSGPPAVAGVEVVSDSGSDDTYALGETIRVRVTFSEAVEVDTTGGAPRLRIDMDPATHWGMKWATYTGGSGTESLTFSHEVVQPNESTQGIAVLADTLEANGGAIRSASTGTDAGLGHDGLDHDPAHKVDWRLARAANFPATGAATITGTAQVGETLTADTSGIADDDGLDNAVFGYQWLADDVEISGATGSTYTLAAADEGKAVKVKVSFTDDAGNDESLTSVATAAVEAAPPENNAATGAATITGTAQVGETLTADTSGISDDDGLDNAVFGYQWLADDADISGAASSTYTLATADEGKTVRVKVSFTDDAGNDESLASEATSAVAAAALPPPAPTNLVATDNGNATVTLTWDAPEDDGVTGYQVLRRRPTEGEGTLLVYVADTGSTDTTWTDEDVTIGARHVYRVKAISAAGLSGASKFDRATPASPPENNAATGAATITGTAQVGETLTADTSGISDADGLDNAVFSYQWLAGGAGIFGATGSAFTPLFPWEGPQTNES